MNLFVFDIDGTLVNKEQKISSTSVLCLSKLLEKNNYVAIASGRSFFGIKKFFNKIKDFDDKKYIICTNGSTVCDFFGKILFKENLKLKDYKLIYNFMVNDKNVVTFCYKDDYIGYFKEDGFIEFECESNNMEPLKFNMDDDDDILIDKVMCFSKIQNYFKNLVLPKNIIDNFNIVASNRYFLEFAPKNVDKSSGVKFLAKYLNIKDENIYTFGDAGNDISMIKNYNGIAMGNSIDEVKNVAKFITKSVDEDGVSYALKEILGIL